MEENKEMNHEVKPVEEKPVHSVEEKAQGNVSATKANLTNKMRDNPWMLSTLVLGVFTLILLMGGDGGITGEVISANDAAQKLLTYYENNGADGIVIDSVEEENGLYKVNFDYQGSIVPIYTTKDGSLAGSLTPLGSAPSAGAGSSGGSAAVATDVSIDDDSIKGDVNAPVTIIEFSDYECPFCGRHYTQTLPQIVENYVDSGKVRIVFRDFPLNFHPNAQKAGEAAECAGEQGKYWEMHDKLFDNQNSLGEDDLKRYASEIGLNTATFNACLDNGDMAQEVIKDLEDGQAAGVSGTPANFINGKLVSGACPYSAFEDAIEAELAGNEWSISNCRVSVL